LIPEECACCRRAMDKNEIKFVARVTLVADDGSFIEDNADPNAEVIKFLEHINRHQTHKDEDSFFEERVYILCSNCQTAFMENPFGRKNQLLFEGNHIGSIQ